MNPQKMLAFHGDPAIKARYIARVKAHAEADEIVQGIYWEAGKGCAVGCTIEGSEHDRYETELGIPPQIAHIEDGLFEAIENDDAKAFPLQFLECIPVGADLSMVVSHLMFDLLADPEHGVLQTTNLHHDVRKAAEAVAQCYCRRLTGDEPAEEEWEEAGKLARVAWDAWVARDAQVAQVAWDAVGAPVAPNEVCLWQRDRLLHHLRNSPVPETVEPGR